MYFVYVIYNKLVDKIYIGQTKDISKRLNMHNNKIFKNCYTARFNGKWELIYKEEVTTCHEALIREKQLKNYRGREFVKKFIPE